MEISHDGGDNRRVVLPETPSDETEPGSEQPAPATTSRRGWAFRMVAATLLPLLALGLLEGALRLGGYDHPPGGTFLRFLNPDLLRSAEQGDRGPTIPDPDLFWRLRPGWKYGDGMYAINQRGFRGDEFSEKKLPGSRRVVCLGDSTAHGLRTPAPKSWIGRTQHALRNRLGTDGIEVLNLAVPGYTSFQGLRLFELEARRYEPDVVVAAFGAFNDWVPAVGRPDAEQHNRPAWHRIRIAQWLLALTASTPQDDGPQTVQEAELLVKKLDTSKLVGDRRVPLEAFERNLRALAHAVHASGARFVIVIQPLPQDTRTRNPAAADYAARARQVAADVADGLADGWTSFAKLPETDQLFIDFCHLNADGHGALAPAVIEALVPLLEE